MAPKLIDINGICIDIYSRDHLPPHIHVFSGEDEALINIRTGKLFAGHISKKKLKMVHDWLNEGEHRQLAERNFYELNPHLEPETYYENRRMGKSKNRKTINTKRNKSNGNKSK